MSGGGGDQQVTQKVEPWGPSGPYLEKGLGGLDAWATQMANQAAASGDPWKYFSYQGPRVAPWDPLQNQASALGSDMAWNNITGRDSGYGDLGALNKWNQENLSHAYTTPALERLGGAWDGWGGLAQTAGGTLSKGAFDAMDQVWNAPGYGSMGKNVGGEYAQQAAEGIASAWGSPSGINATIQGAMLTPDKNPYLQAYAEGAVRPIQKQLLEKTLPGINTTANAAGRMGSGAWSKLSSDAISEADKNSKDVMASIYAPAYQQERGLQMEAFKYPKDLYSLERGIQTQQQQVPIQLYGMERGFQNQAQSLPFQAYAFERGMEDKSANRQFEYMDELRKNLGTMFGIGEAKQGQAQEFINADMAAQEENIYKALDFINSYLGSAMSLGQVGRQQSSYMPGGGTGLASNLLGVGSGLAGLGGLAGMF